MFAQNQTDQLEAAALASQHMKSWEKILALRISLQKSIDVGNQLPAENMTELYGLDSDSNIVQSTKVLCKGLQSVLTELVEVSNVQAENINDKYKTANNKRKRSTEVSWEDVVAPQDIMTPYWESVVNKWHARLNFGSEQAKSKLKVFNQSIWDQIDETLSNESRVVEKSRVPLGESTRMKINTSSGTGNNTTSKTHTSSLLRSSTDPAPSDEEEDSDPESDNEQTLNNLAGLNGYDRKENKQYDLEVYDDRSFYSMLLKTFITSSSSGANGQNMRADDLEALRKYKRKKSTVERKASKGRKIRYTVHQKLQNFMFPVPLQNNLHLDIERLHASLFQ